MSDHESTTVSCAEAGLAKLSKILCADIMYAGDHGNLSLGMAALAALSCARHALNVILCAKMCDFAAFTASLWLMSAESQMYSKERIWRVVLQKNLNRVTEQAR